ncbi:uncharacterized protein A1O9_04694 [Exophiala aquamarina CBS 119918]|uniref:DUF2406 domain-containing protein n=1 Tax=Exophiala aquamarina CBS 119918 TaxID=1182545 RepID=A0A072PJ06_9EURO|nr:uncharacterized protein A1O9_04694 [Exophiala aquamarina CBS 119918]KEF59846.1 hypothetical protein A1O9_04694 [Exophiala aquamarina CBS 119918]
MSPISPQPQETRPRAQTSVSYTSQRSRRSSSSGHRLELTESAKDKKRLNTKADPSRALNEATPAEQAQEASTVDDLRLMMHKDVEGNVITDPDRSNPTRSRMERPLDTIRAFNAAAEGTTSRRSSLNSRPPSQIGWNSDMNRRGSYYSSEHDQVIQARSCTNFSLDNGYSPQRSRPTPGGGYYRSGSYGFGPQSSVEEEPGSAQVYGRGMRQQSNPDYGMQNGYQNAYQNAYQISHPHANSNGYQNGQLANGQNNHSPMSAHSYQHSYETMTSGSDEYSKSTNPSSQNSSFDQLHQLRKPDDFSAENPYANDIKFNQFAPTKPFSPQIMHDGPYGPDAVQAPLPPANAYPLQNGRQPINLNASQFGGDTNGNDDRPTPPAKRQSWIKRRFSRRET